MIQPSDLLRYGLWAMMAATADANRREFHMVTTWLPHFLMNTFALFLPELDQIVVPDDQRTDTSQDFFGDIRESLDALVRDNPAYAAYVAPIPIGYILSHPRFNIYKGELAEIRFLGFGLDALPHGLTALTMTTLYCEATDKAASKMHSQNALSKVVKESAQRPALYSGLILVLATLWWEIGEYLVHRHELAQRGGDITKINMMWGWRDTLNDSAANAIGWALALGLRRFYRKR